jgi:hypothetical protein
VSLVLTAPGVINSTDMRQADRGSNNVNSSFSTDGAGVYNSEFSIGGAPSTIADTQGNSSSYRVAFIPPQSAISEFKVQTAPFDASLGRASGSLITVSTKSGTKAVTCAGIQPELPGADAPLTASINIEYPEDYLATFTLGYRAMQYDTSNDQLKQFHGDKARFDIGRESFALYPGSKALEIKPSMERTRPRSFGRSSPAHIRNFIERIQSRREPNAPVEAGQDANIALCMTMESLRKGRRLRWNDQARRVEG